ncbi:MAG: host-nuclease inhibitor Gam family protein [Candidatus Cloacimonetes bacterium]|nr:host-nuclease inhibitor Gam family protein [Candidatus Cloacimonadota bacterium]
MNKDKQNPQTPTITSWEEANLALKSLGELSVQIRELENKKTELISDITAKFDADAAPILSDIKTITSEIESFATLRKDEFIEKRSKELSHGTISMRVSTSVKIISKAICIKVLKAMGMEDFIKTTENPNKDMLATLSDIQLAKLSCERKTTDKISIEPKIEQILPPDTPAAKKELKK